MGGGKKELIKWRRKLRKRNRPKRVPPLASLYKKAAMRRTHYTGPYKRVLSELEKTHVRYCLEHKASHYFIDVYLPEYGIAIEFDDKSHNKEGRQRRDAHRTAILVGGGFVKSVIRFTYEDIKERFTFVMDSITKEISKGEKHKPIIHKCKFCHGVSIEFNPEEEKSRQRSFKRRGARSHKRRVRGALGVYAWKQEASTKLTGEPLTSSPKRITNDNVLFL